MEFKYCIGRALNTLREFCAPCKSSANMAASQYTPCPAMYLCVLPKEVDQFPASTLQVRRASYLLLIKYTFSYDSSCSNGPQKSSGCSQATVWIALMENSLRALIFKAKCSCRGAIREQLTGCMCIVSASTPQQTT